MFNLANNMLYIIQYLNSITIIARKFLNMDFKMGFFFGQEKGSEYERIV